MFTSVRSIYSVIGVMLFLIALYLVLEKAGGASSLIGSLSNFGVNVTKALQGR